MGFRPIHDKILVKQKDEEDVTAGGIVLAGNAKEKPCQGEVIAVGEGVLLDNGEYRRPSVAVGSTVVFGTSAGHKVEVEDEEYLVMHESEIYAVID